MQGIRTLLNRRIAVTMLLILVLGGCTWPTLPDVSTSRISLTNPFGRPEEKAHSYRFRSKRTPLSNMKYMNIQEQASKYQDDVETDEQAYFDTNYQPRSRAEQYETIPCNDNLDIHRENGTDLRIKRKNICAQGAFDFVTDTFGMNVEPAPDGVERPEYINSNESSMNFEGNRDYPSDKPTEPKKNDSSEQVEAVKDPRRASIKSNVPDDKKAYAYDEIDKKDLIYQPKSIVKPKPVVKAPAEKVAAPAQTQKIEAPVMTAPASTPAAKVEVPVVTAPTPKTEVPAAPVPAPAPIAEIAPVQAPATEVPAVQTPAPSMPALPVPSVPSLKPSAAKKVNNGKTVIYEVSDEDESEEIPATDSNTTISKESNARLNNFEAAGGHKNTLFEKIGASHIYNSLMKSEKADDDTSLVSPDYSLDR